MDEARRLKQQQLEIESGLRLATLDAIPEGTGQQFIQELKTALASGNRDGVLAALKRVGDTIHARWGFTQPTNPVYEEAEGKYRVALSTGTAGTRLFINIEPHQQYPGNLIFPNADLERKSRGRLLVDVFLELFGDKAENVGSPERPYYVVHL